MVPIVVKFGEGKIFPKNAAEKSAAGTWIAAAHSNIRNIFPHAMNRCKVFMFFGDVFGDIHHPKNMNMSHEKSEKVCFFEGISL